VEGLAAHRLPAAEAVDEPPGRRRVGEAPRPAAGHRPVDPCGDVVPSRDRPDLDVATEADDEALAAVVRERHLDVTVGVALGPQAQPPPELEHGDRHGAALLLRLVGQRAGREVGPVAGRAGTAPAGDPAQRGLPGPDDAFAEAAGGQGHGGQEHGGDQRDDGHVLDRGLTGNVVHAGRFAAASRDVGVRRASRRTVGTKS
jgi:hypothetical protein